MSEKYTMIVFSNPVEGREDEYNKWYDEVHLGEFSSLPSVTSGQRFEVDGGKPRAYAAVYETTAPAAQVMAEMQDAVKAGSVHMSDSIDVANAQIVVLKAR